MDIKKISFPFPNLMDPAIEEIIEPLATKRYIDKKSTLLHANDTMQGMYYIHSGSTRHFTTSVGGIEKILYILSPGWFFGEPAYFMHTKTGLNTSAETDLELWYISDETMTMLLDTYPQVRNAVMSELTYKLLFLRHETESLCFNSCEDRLMRTICMCVDESNLIDGSWYSLKIQYTHYDLGVLIGSVRVTVSKILGKLCADGVLRLVNHRIQINAKDYNYYMVKFFEQYLL